MFRHFIARKSFEHEIECFCPDRHHAGLIAIHRGDIIELTNERQFIPDRGWYFLINMNNERHFYMALKDLDNYYDSGELVSLIDLELKENYCKYKINAALDTGDEDTFIVFTCELKESRHLKEHIKNHLYQSEA
ncbi:MAG: hypothetical protein ACQEXB_08160 [Bacillota bacterium]